MSCRQLVGGVGSEVRSLRNFICQIFFTFVNFYLINFYLIFYTFVKLYLSNLVHICKILFDICQNFYTSTTFFQISTPAHLSIILMWNFAGSSNNLWCLWQISRLGAASRYLHNLLHIFRYISISSTYPGHLVGLSVHP